MCCTCPPHSNVTMAVIFNVLFREKADVVFLQEVVPDTLSVIEEQCPMFQAIPSAHEGITHTVVFSEKNFKH